MGAINTSVGNTEELLRICCRSIVAPDMIITEANRVINLLNDTDLEQKYLVQGCETLSLLAAGFVRSGYDSFISHYAQKSGINHSLSGFDSRDALIKFCEFCVEFGEECLGRIHNTVMRQLEIENRMTKDEICSLNIKKFELREKIQSEDNDPEIIERFYEADRSLITVQDQVTRYIKLALLVNSLKDFFKEYYKGLN